MLKDQVLFRHISSSTIVETCLLTDPNFTMDEPAGTQGGPGVAGLLL
jgi:hypothetical protein